MSATLGEVAAELEKLGIKTQILGTKRTGITTGCINVWTGNQLGSPDTTVWPPQIDNPAFDSWSWGHHYEHSAYVTDDAVTVAQKVSRTLPQP